jgi:hypothetical protein
VTVRSHPWTDADLRAAAAVAAWSAAPVERILSLWLADMTADWPDPLP